MSPGPLVVRCPAKVNLHLEVLGRRPDGYHELRTLLVAVGVWDELSLFPVADGTLRLDVEPAGAVPADADNLVLRAAAMAREAWGVAAGAHIALRKSIPVGGGMGGGSADAAAALVGLARLWESSAAAAELHALAARLGSDVPFFLVGGAAWGEGRGTDLRPLPDLPPWWLVLLPGEAPISTAQVYSALEVGTLRRSPSATVYDWITGGGELPLSACRNDLEPTVVARWPAVGRRLEAIRGTDQLLAMLSGSGGTVFAVYPDEARAHRAASRLGPYGPLVAPLLGRALSLLRPSVLEGP